MINSWNILKEHAIKNCTYPKGTVGYLKAIHSITSLFIDLRREEKFKDIEDAEKAFNEDEDVREAILQGQLLKDLEKI